MKLELQDEKGLTGVFIEVTPEQLREGLGLGSSSVESEAQLQESQGKVTELESKIAELEGKMSLVDRVAAWVDTHVIAEMVVDHLKSEDPPATFEKAKAVWLDTLGMLGSHLAELKEKLTTVGGRTMDDFTQIEKANFVIAWGRGLSVEDKAIFAEAVGIPIAKLTEAELAEVEAKRKAEEEKGEPSIIVGKTDKPGYKYLDYLNLSVKE